jgi:hypothetical protein
MGSSNWGELCYVKWCLGCWRVVWWLDVNISEDRATSVFRVEVHYIKRRNNPENQEF